MQNFIELLIARVDQHNEHAALDFLDDNLSVVSRMTFPVLERRAKAIAAFLRERHPPGERALLLFAPGADYISCFFGCLFAGIIPVPAYPPQSPREFIRLQTIIKDAGASMVCTSSPFLPMLKMWLSGVPELAAVDCIASDTIEDAFADGWRCPKVSADDIAFLQYTSGSTGDPKGVMVTHANLMDNSRQIQDCFGTHEQGVIWLPPYHDMGLIGGILQPVYGGFSCALMSPVTFLKHPLRWLEAISRYRATISGGPNFAYELVLQRCDEAFVSTLNLEHWRVAFNGAEAIKVDTLQRFADTFKSAGFRQEAFLPCYGLAEATLIVTGCDEQARFTTLKVEPDSVQHHFVKVSEADDAKALVSSGRVVSGDVCVVKPDTLRVCDAGEIGEILVANRSVAKGYWRKEELSKEVFGAVTADGRGPFLRTGDLGFLMAGELYVTGRAKELIILNGKNYYPVDIESTVQGIDIAFRRGCGACFSIQHEDSEQLVVVQEIRKDCLEHFDTLAGLVNVKSRIVSEHSIKPFDIVFIKHQSLPKTTSGKIQRNQTRKHYLEGKLSVIASLRATTDSELAAVIGRLETRKAESVTKDSGKDERHVSASTEQYISLIQGALQRVAGIDTTTFGIDSAFSELGLDSKDAVGLIGELESKLKRHLDANLVFNYPSISSLAAYLSGENRASPVESADQKEKARESEPVAIVGMSCRFPGGSDSSSAYWKFLLDGKDGITEVPPTRWDIERYYDPNVATPGKMSTRWGGFIDHVDKFDAAIFGVSPKEASAMDPQQRLLLETSWHALEDARINVHQLAGTNTGVFIGISSNDYGRLQQGLPSSMDTYAGTGNALSIAANRLSYYYDLRGPSIAVDTACSSSLVALHTACNYIRSGDCDIALVGGVNVILAPDLTVTFSQARMMSPEGRCKAFNEDADGYVRGEGCGVVVLKPLSKAIADGDYIWATVRGSAVNQDGKSNGITAPNGLSQELVIRRALAQAGIKPGDVDYVEAHGTGTPLGDPIEIEALNNVYGDPERRAKLKVGTAKTNIGHLEAAAGMAGLIKTAQAIKYRTIPANLHYKTPSTRIDWENNQVEIVNKLQPWPHSQGRKRLAGLSSFGFGGTNAHVILESYTGKFETKEPDVREAELFTISARQPKSLQDLAKRHLETLDDNTNLTAYTGAINTSRALLRCRSAFTVRSIEELRSKLNALVEQESINKRGQDISIIDKRPRTAFLFTGQGAQYSGMGRSLYARVPEFKRWLDACEKIILDLEGFSVLDVLFDSAWEDKLHQTQYTQVALFAFEYAYAKTWISYGIRPSMLIGHSVGEFAAACIAEVFSLEDALKLVVNRGKLMQPLSPAGSMLALNCDEPTAAGFIEQRRQRVSLGAVNAADQIVLSGDEETLAQIQAEAQSRGIKSTPLKVSHGFHSPMMWPMLEEFLVIARQVRYAEPKFQVISNITGAVEPKRLATPEYWRDHVAATVHYASGIQTVLDSQCNVFVEIGPKPVLQGLTRRVLGSAPQDKVHFVSGCSDKGDGWENWLEGLKQAFLSGHIINWKQLYLDTNLPVIRLPRYPFERRRYWIDFEEGARMMGEVPASIERHTHPANKHSLLGQRVHSPVLKENQALFQLWLRQNHLAPLEQQSAEQTSVMPPTVFFEMALEVGRELLDTTELALKDFIVIEPLHLQTEGAIGFQIVAESAGADSGARGAIQLKMFSQKESANQASGQWQLHVTGQIERGLAIDLERGREAMTFKDNTERSTKLDIKKIDLDAYYAQAREYGFTPSSLQALKQLWVDSTEALGEIVIGSNWQAEHHVWHPLLVDACMQVLWSAKQQTQHDALYLPVGLRRLDLRPRKEIDYEKPIYVHAKIADSHNHDLLSAKITIFDDTDQIIAIFEDVLLKKNEKQQSLLHKLHAASPEVGVQLLTRRIQEQLAASLKFNVEDVDTETALVDIGMDSLAAMDLLIVIEETLGVEINIMKLMEGINTIELAEYILDILPPASGEKKSRVEAGQFLSLVELNKQKQDKPTLFFVHPIGGSVFCYREMAKILEGNLHLVGLQSPVLTSSTPVEPVSLKEMASGYVKEILRYQNKGPFHLGGWSMGGVIAQEIAVQLVAAGESIKSVIIVDGMAPDLMTEKTRFQESELLEILAKDIGLRQSQVTQLNLGTVSESDGFKAIFDLASREELLPGRLSEADIYRRYTVFKNNLAALYGAVPAVLDARIELIKARTTLPQHRNAPDDLGWARLCTQGTSVSLVEGDHFDLVKRPNVVALASIIQTLLLA